jgi:hypothetical protein
MKTLLLICFLGFASLGMAQDSCTGTTSCSLTGTHAATDIVIIWAYRAGSTTAPTLGSGTNITNGSSSTGASRSWRASCLIAGTTGTVATGTWTNATNIVAFTSSGSGATTTANCVTNGIGTIGTANNVSSATATYSALTMSASPKDSSEALLLMGSSTSGQTCTPTGATVLANTGDVRASHANLTGNWSTTTCSITSSVTTEIVIELKAAVLTAPTFSPGTGTYGGSATVTPTIPGGSAGCYSTDGSTPAATSGGTCSAGSTYTSGDLSAFTSTQTLKMIATESGFINSSETDATYTINTFTGLLPLMGVGGVHTVLPITHAKSGAGFCSAGVTGGMGTGAGTFTSSCNTASSATFTYTAVTAGDLVVFTTDSNLASTSNVSSLAASGWSLNSISCSAGSNCTSGTFGTSTNRTAGFWAFAPNTSQATFTLSTGAAATNFLSVVIDEFSNTDPTSPIDASAVANGASGTCTASVTPTVANDALVSGCYDTVSAVGSTGACASSACIKGGDDTQSDWSEYKILSGGSGISQVVPFTGSSGAWQEVLVAIKPQP